MDKGVISIRGWLQGEQEEGRKIINRKKTEKREKIHEMRKDGKRKDKRKTDQVCGVRLVLPAYAWALSMCQRVPTQSVGGAEDQMGGWRPSPHLALSLSVTTQGKGKKKRCSSGSRTTWFQQNRMAAGRAAFWGTQGSLEYPRVD